MNKPHKHCELIKAWADGAEIQVKVSGTWSNPDPCPIWCEVLEYRIKPPTIRFRVALCKHLNQFKAFSADNEIQADAISMNYGFVRWLTDWIEVEV